ncbi:hypothetical protein PS627_01538 [Pseudomonas fluorescens]|uniref:hypothetical protein n=1 Tax=Pseudomonas fluorescens TaxID=294 RepID=UPI001256E8A6|nr:hypothetical protein [Pseudomonas fluorescens]CAG8865619.1 hypothetical protein PS627_01538 [Pseudomonas fluorescens]VVP86735.1 hypothetical protein PS910_02479 [Pseudomonas fluorescens]
MELQQVKTLKEAQNVEEAEKLISEGWKLLAIIPTIRANGGSQPCYVLGKPREVSESSIR